MRLSATRLSAIVSATTIVPHTIYYALLYTEASDQLTTEAGDELTVPLPVQ